jgi:hypothetical protein
MQQETIVTVGVLLLALVTVESGGVFLTRVVGGDVPATDFQRGFYRAGHAHAAVLLVLSIAILSVVDAAELSAPWDGIARFGVPVAAILMPAGFFFSAMGRGRERPNRWVAVLWAGVLVLTVSLIVAGISFIASGLG